MRQQDRQGRHLSFLIILTLLCFVVKQLECSPHLNFTELTLESPYKLLNVLEPMKPQYFTIDVPAQQNYNALSLSILCNQQTTTGCTTTTQINITTDPLMFEKYESLWSKQENTSFPGELITVQSTPPFKPGRYYISVMTLVQNITTASILVQAYSDSEAKLMAVAAAGSNNVVKVGEEFVTIHIARNYVEEKIELMRLPNFGFTSIAKHNIPCLNAYLHNRQQISSLEEFKISANDLKVVYQIPAKLLLIDLNEQYRKMLIVKRTRRDETRFEPMELDFNKSSFAKYIIAGLIYCVFFFA